MRYISTAPDDISCTFEGGRCRTIVNCTFEGNMCRWIDESDWDTVGYNGTHLSNPIAVQGLLYLKPAENSSLILKSPFLTRKRQEACFVIQAYSTEYNSLYLSQSNGIETKYPINGKMEWQMFKLPIAVSSAPDRVILRFENDDILLDDFVYAEQACDNIGEDCSDGAFLCENSTCIQPVYKCDGVPHCISGSDEENCEECKNDAYLCEDNRCIHPMNRCDGVEHCLSGSDEDNCANCKNDAYLCENSTCIHSEYRCDGVPHCFSGLDEENCDSCKNGTFQCDNLQCVPAESRCDWMEQCNDGSDEWDCGARCDAGNVYKCSNSKRCIYESERCDGNEDCEEGDDERYNCYNCKNGAYRCWGYQCVPKGSECDGIPQCQDHRDEWDCNSQSWSGFIYIFIGLPCLFVLCFCGFLLKCAISVSRKRHRPSTEGTIQGVSQNNQHTTQPSPEFAMQPLPGCQVAVNDAELPPSYVEQRQTGDEMLDGEDVLPSYNTVNYGNFVQITVPAKEAVARMRQQMAPSTIVTRAGDTETYINSAYI